MTIESIFLNGELSVRSYHSCKSSEIETVKELIAYFYKHKNFLKLRMCGKRSSEELIRICETYLDCYEKEDNEINEVIPNEIVDKILTLNRSQRQIINSYITIQFSNLSTRSKNALNIYLDNKIDINNLSDKIFSILKFNFNIGKGSIIELEIFMNKIRNFLVEIYEINNENDLNKFKYELFLKKEFSNVEIPNELIDKNSIFSLVKFLITENILFGKNETYIFENGLSIYQNSIYQNLDKLAENLPLSKERCRQIRVKILEELYNKFNFIKKIDQNFFLNYNLDFDEFFIIISDETELKINTIDETNFSKQFITLICSFFFENEFELLGNIDDVLIEKDFKARNRHNWKALYLINRKLSKLFNFVKFIEDIESRNIEFIDETYSFNFKSYLTKFFKTDDYYLLDTLFNVCERLINEEFNIYLNTDESVVFERKSFKALPEYALEALEILGKPSHIDEINKQIKILKPDYENIIKNTTLKREFGFVPFGRASIFGLKKWENGNDNVKGGTIRSIAQEFIEKFNVPIHIDEIEQFVLKYRPETNKKSILYNLKMEENNRFLFYENTFIGLKSKKYNGEDYKLLNNNDKILKQSWEDNYQDLLDFISKNNRLPSSMSCPDNEIRINRWLNVQSSKANRGLLEQSKTDLINKIRSEYNGRTNKSTLFRNNGYARLKEFIENHKRLPIANKSDENQLYAFFYKQRKLYLNSKLEKEEEIQFLEIIKLIQNIKI